MLTPAQLVSRRRFSRDVHAETEQARVQWLGMEDHASAEVWLAVATEELGKLARAINKQHLADDSDVVIQWQQEGRIRMVMIASIMERLEAVWPIS